MKLLKKKILIRKRRFRVRKKLSGTAERPRLSVHFSGKHIYAQCIDDQSGTTLASASSLAKDVRSEGLKANVEGAAKLGAIFGAKAKEAKIEKVIFDRGERRYHGAVKAFAEAVRETGIQF